MRLRSRAHQSPALSIEEKCNSKAKSVRPWASRKFRSRSTIPGQEADFSAQGWLRFLAKGDYSQLQKVQTVSNTDGHHFVIAAGGVLTRGEAVSPRTVRFRRLASGSTRRATVSSHDHGVDRHEEVCAEHRQKVQGKPQFLLCTAGAVPQGSCLHVRPGRHAPAALTTSPAATSTA